jgi:hypothetical protein
MDMLRQAVSPENREQVYAMIGGFLQSIFSTLLSVIQKLSEGLLELRTALYSISGVLQIAFSYLMEAFAMLPKKLTGMSDKDQQRMFMSAMGVRSDGQASLTTAQGLRAESGVALASVFAKEQTNLDKALNDFLKSIRGATKGTETNTAEATAAAAAAATTARNRGIISSIMDGSYMSSGAGPAVKKLMASALTTIDPSAGMDILANTSDPQVMQGLSSFLMENKNVPKAMQQAADSLLNLTPEKIQEGAAGLWDGFKMAFMPEDKPAIDPAMAAQLGSVTAGIGKAIVGDFQSSRGNMLQMVPKMEQLQERANKLLEDGNDIGEDIAASLKKSGVFA